MEEINAMSKEDSGYAGEKNAESKQRAKQMKQFGLPTFLYAVFCTFCLYRNSSGITYPFFVAGTLFFSFYYMKKCGVSGKKGSVFYIAALLLLGLSTCLTDSAPLIFMNKLGIFLLLFCLFFHNLYEDSSFSLSIYAGGILRTLMNSLFYLNRPLGDLFVLRRERKKGVVSPEQEKGRETAAGMFAGILIAVPLVFVVILLLVSADAVFSRIVKNILDSLHFNPFAWFNGHLPAVVCLTVFTYFLSYCIPLSLGRRDIAGPDPDRRRFGPVSAITFTGILSGVYLLFCAIQIICLFLGGMALPEGYTYAKYAREGFFQLLLVCLINLGLVLACLAWFRENRTLKLLLTVVCGCTYILIFSSAYRMILYIRAYHLTFLRVLVLWCLSVIFLLMTGILISLYRSSFPLFRYFVVVVTVLYTVFSLSHPDYWIARYDLHQIAAARESGELYGSRFNTAVYLGNLSTDAFPAIAQEDNPDLRRMFWYNDYLEKIERRTGEQGLRTFNVSRYRAAKLLRAHAINARIRNPA